VAVVVDSCDYSRRFDLAAELFHYAFGVDARIEPKCVFWDEYQRAEPCSVLEEILRTGIEIV
jgi:hypothetical protein